MRAEYIDHMGGDLAVVNAARVSFDNHHDFLDPNRDHRLIRYLAQHGHWTPFGHVQVKLRMQAPVPIRTQCFKHKMGFVENEESRRYVAKTPELFIPDVFREAPQQAKQGSGYLHDRSRYWRARYHDQCLQAINLYEAMIDDGVAPEQARFVLPQGVEVQWVWTGSLAAYARFLRLRRDPHAQREIQELASQVNECLYGVAPVSLGELLNV